MVYWTITGQTAALTRLQQHKQGPEVQFRTPAEVKLSAVSITMWSLKVVTVGPVLLT